jgi:hypothetical protein
MAIRKNTVIENPNLTIGELAWFAAVIEVKAGITKKTHAARKTPQVSLYVDTRQLEIVNRLCTLTGQKVEPKSQRPLTKFDRRSCDIHCPTPHVHVNDYEDNRKELMPTKRWTISGASIVVVLHNTVQYMTSEGQNKFSAILVDAKANVPMNGQGSGMVKNGIRRLALLGWNLPKDYLVAME